MKDKYLIDTHDNRDFLRHNAEDLWQFGQRFPSPGGSSYYLGDNGEPWKDRNRETWITSRMVHTYSIGKMKGYPGSEELASAGIKGLLGELYDGNNGGWYAGLTEDGNILPGKHCYAHAFVILAGTSAYLAGIKGGEELLRKALSVYDDRFWNESEGLSCDSWDTQFTECDEYRGLNANMHTVEAFLAVADALNDETYRDRAGRIIDRVLAWATNNSYRIPEHFNSDWSVELEMNRERPDDQFKPYGATPGHAIEWARLVTQWATSRFGMGSDKAKAYIDEAERLFRTAIKDAWNADGNPGIVYTTDWTGKPIVQDRMHWTLAEAINTSAVLFRYTGSDEYAEHYSEFMAYLDSCVLDHNCGSWYHQLDKNNRVKITVWPGKPDLYHAIQANLIPYAPINVSIAKAIYDEEGKS